jgi:beta-phosphoglucomutase family hydrolase/Cof subfamily protein (haloacid dehalogenase superfamily)
MSGVKLLVADVDGTLVTRDKRLTARAEDAVRRLREAGIAFAITSGRPPRGMRMLVEPLAITTPVAAFNGGMLVEPDLSTTLHELTIPRAASLEAVERMIAAGLDVWVYAGTEWFVRRLDAPHVAREQATVEFAPSVVADLTTILDGAVKVVGVGDDFAIVERCEGELRERLAGHVSASRSQPYYLDVTHPDANKGTVVRELSNRLGVPPGQIATIGDMPNDVLMFGIGGVSIAMGNASSQVQRAAKYVTTSNEDEGFANAVERFVLKSPKNDATLGLPPRTRACLFDLDGVLTQTAKVHAAAWKTAFDEFLRTRPRASGAPFVPFDQVRDYDEYVDGRPRNDGVRSFLASRDIRLPDGDEHDPPSAETVHGLGNRKNEIFMRLLHSKPVATYEGSVRYVREAKNRGFLTAVVSSSKHTREVLESAGITELFDVDVDGVVADREHLAGKPAPDTYLAAARALAVEPSQAAVFEDALAGVEAGRAGHFGCVIGVDRVGQAALLRQHGADVVVSDLSALLGAP